MTAGAVPSSGPRRPPPHRFLVHLGRVVFGSVQYSIASRRFAVLFAILLGLVLLALTVTAQAAAPLLLYPFA